MRINSFFLLLFAIVMVSCHSREIGFIYTPSEPRAGQTVTFTNTSEIGDTWSWNFGDGTSSVSKSPTKVYKRAGEYVVTLKVDDRKSLTYSAVINILDTVPTITSTDSVLSVYKSVKFGVSCYNPNKLALSYQWLFSSNAVVDTGYSATDSLVSVYFRKASDIERVSVVVTMADKVDTVSREFKVRDVLVPSIVVCTPNNSLRRYRLFEQGLEFQAELQTQYSINHLFTYHNLIYICNNTGIAAADILGQTNTLIESSQPIIAATILNDSLFWKGASDMLHGLPLGQKAVSSGENELTDWRAADSQITSSVYMTTDGGDMCFAGNGYVIGTNGFLSEYSGISAMAVDRVNGKVYFVVSESGLLFVTNISGRLEDVAIIGVSDSRNLAVSHELDRLFYTNDNKLYSLPLIHTERNIVTVEPVELCGEAVNFCFDNQLR